MAKENTLPQLNRIYQADALSFVRTLPDRSIDMVITSPPYWALRDYGVKGQLGLEPTFQEYLSRLCDIFDEVKRALKPEGTCWVNLGDTYGGSGAGTGINTYHSKESYHLPYGKALSAKLRKTNYQKCLLQIPSRFAIEMTNRRWILRNEIIWHKPNAMPTSVKDRFTVDYEKIFFFSKSKRYHFEQQFEPYVPNSDMVYRKKLRIGRKYGVKRPYQDNQPLSYSKSPKINLNGRNKRCVWQIPTKPFSDAHFAVYPPILIEIPIKAGCPAEGIVFDPFMGAGTTALVALKLGRRFLGCELNPAYIKIASNRLQPYFNNLKEAA